MATVVLQAVGTAIGGAIGGPFGAVLGRAAGAIAGAYVDQQLFGPGDQQVFGPRLDNAQVLTSREGAAVPRLFGTTRLSGEIIWATRFEEVINNETRSAGGKGGGPKTTVSTYTYFGNFAVSLCEGVIGGIGRIWVDGQELEQTKHTIRVHKGTETQLPDSLIEAKQGQGNTPAYRGLAYIVFENFALEEYGNRLPQVAVEVTRPVGQLEQHIRAVNMIPGASEFAYETERVDARVSETEIQRLNNHQTRAETDFLASLDELQAVCPNLEQVALVVAWFGDDLRAGHCTIRPKVEVSNRDLSAGKEWNVGPIDRTTAELVSVVDGSLAYGGTPSDTSVLHAIAEMKSRGLRVCLNPFLMMDIPPDNTLPNPGGGLGQPAYPWRGRISGETGNAVSDVAAFSGMASASDITVAAGTILHGSLTEWSYRRMILHYARLAELAGGIDMFLIGSEMRGLTSLRDAANTFPFVTALTDIADDVRPILGTNCLVTYGADWSEYFGYHPDDASGDVFFNLDPLWSSANIDAIGIDNYMPLSDFRDATDVDEGRASHDPAMLLSQVASGEGFDWYYASSTDREAGVRTTITDGLGKPWTFRYKDIQSWWSNPHFERVNGIEKPAPTGWQPQSKPIIFTEFGAPAIHNGAAQPNVFFDPTSSESFTPYFSNGGRDDFAQAAYLEAHQKYWDSDYPDHAPGGNPLSQITGEPMVDMHRAQVWAWDARPYSAFPARTDIWSDGKNWYTGHWLNGRLGRLRLADLIAELLSGAGVPSFDVTQVYGVVDGYVLADVGTARSALEALLNLYNISVHENAGTLHFRSQGAEPLVVFNADLLVTEPDQSKLSSQSEQVRDLPLAISMQHVDEARDYLSVETSARRTNGSTLQEHTLSMPMAVSANVVEAVLENWLRTRWTARQSIGFSLARNKLALTVGDHIVFDDMGSGQPWQITRVEEAEKLQISAKAVELGEIKPVPVVMATRLDAGVAGISAPLVHFLDLPFIGGPDTINSNRIAVRSNPWPGPMAVYSSPADDSFAFRQIVAAPATMGVLQQDLPPSSTFSRWSFKGSVDVRLFGEALFSATNLSVFGGANALAIRSSLGSWEIIQFSKAEPLGDNVWRISQFLRGQRGTEAEALAGSAVDAPIVLLNSAVIPIENSSAENGLLLDWMVGPVGGILGDPEFTSKSYAPGARGLLPFSPSHLKNYINPNGELEVNWKRRDRLSTDDWTLEETAMSEAVEAYQLIISEGGAVKDVRTVNSPATLISAVELANIVDTTPTNIDISVAQISALVGPGPSQIVSLSLN